MCGCFVLLLGAFVPRIALALMALFNNEISRAFDGRLLLAFLGWLLLPYTTLVFVLLSWGTGDVAGIDWFFVALAFLVDLGSYGGGWRRRADVPAYRRG